MSKDGEEDLVSEIVSSSPSRKIVYKCRDWPSTGYCNQGSGFKPGTTYSNMAWMLTGTCEGTFSPTSSPVAYNGTSQYNQCRMTSTKVTCISGSTGCSCSCTPATCKKDVESSVCTPTDVDPWDNNVNYFAGNVVRVGTTRFKCRGGGPYYFLCRMSAYKPQLDSNSIWNQARTTDGVCAAAQE